MASTAERRRMRTPPPLKIRVAAGQVIPRHSCAVVGQQVAVEPVEAGKHYLVLNWPGKVEPGEQRPREDSVKQVFAEPVELVNIWCTIDQRLAGYLTVVPNEVYAWTDARGEFKLPRKLPPGTYTLTACHPELGCKDLKVTIPEQPAEPAERVTFVYEAK